MTRVVVASPGVVYAHTDCDVVEFKNIFNGFVAALSEKGSSAMVLPAYKDAVSAIQELSKKLNAKVDECKFKVVAVSNHVENIISAITHLGGRIEAQKTLENQAAQLFFYLKEGRIRVEKTAVSEGAESSHSRPIKVLIVDDSKTIRMLLNAILSKDPHIHIVGECGLPSEALQLIPKLKPDVITLDIHMPEMTGVDLLQRYIREFPIPTVIITSLSKAEGPLVFEALEQGAIDYIQKPGNAELAEKSALIVDKIKTAARAKVRKNTLAVAMPTLRVANSAFDATKIIAIGSSTGGTEALRELFAHFPDTIPPVVVVQHIPPVFSAAFAHRLNELLPFEVKEASDGDELLPNRVLIAPGGMQMSLVRTDRLRVVITDSAPVNRHKPSVDVLFDAVAKLCGKDAIGAILTGMGGDGAQGLLNMKKAGAWTIGQDEASCVVYGMPKEAAKAGALHEVVSLNQMANSIFRKLGVPTRKSA